MGADRITLEVIGSALSSIAEEMGTALIRSSYSANVKERRDCSTAVFDAEGRVVAQAEHIPMHLGSLLGIVREVLARYPAARLAPGDVFIANDPYAGGGTHLPDINLVSPVFAEGALAGFVANIAHHADRTGARIRTVWDEGLRITPIKLYEAGRLREDVMELLLANFALPGERRGDLRAQLGANRLGERRLAELVGRHGLGAVRAASNEALAHAERMLRSAVAALPDGLYRFADALDGDGVREAAIPIVVAVTVAGDRLHLDFAGSGPQTAGDINVVWLGLLATVYYAVKALLDPSIPPNGGFYRAIEVTAPAGTIVNARPPAPVARRLQTCQRIADAIFGALAPVVPRRVQAAGNGTATWMFSGTDPRTRRPYIYLETHGGGAGATAAGPGLDAVQVHLTNTSNLPVECLETEYPLLVTDYSLADESAGAGRYRGGMGITRTVEVLGHDASFLCTLERTRVPPWGLDGGDAGGRGALTLNPGAASERGLPAKVWDQALRPGERVRITTAGGGGYGPVSRDAT
jgi:N-methylhydantoinase B